MAATRVFLVFAVLASLTISGQGSMSAESMGFLKKALTAVKGQLSTNCERSVMFLMKNARSDDVIAHSCDFVKTFGKSIMREACNDLEMRKMEAVMCKTDFPTQVLSGKFNSDLSEEASTVLQNILNGLSRLNEGCGEFFKSALERIPADHKVFEMCDYVSISRVRGALGAHCSSSEYEAIRDSTCEQIQRFHEEKAMYALSSEASTIIDNIKGNMDKVLSRECKPMTVVVTAVANSDHEIYGLCRLMKTEVGKATITTKCSADDYEKMTGVICQELAKERKIVGEVTFNSQLSQEAQEKFQRILDSVFGITESCATYLTNVAQRVNDDSHVDGLCQMVTGRAKGKFLENCSEQAFKMLEESACNN